MAQPTSPLGKTGSSTIMPIGQTEQAHFGTDSTLKAANPGQKNSTLPG